MNFLRFISSLVKNTQEPKVYAIVLKNSQGGNHLCLLVDYSLEEAIQKGVKKIYEQTGMGKEEGFIVDPKPTLFDIQTVDKLFHGFTNTSFEEPPEEPEKPTTKNSVIRKIIEDNDRKLYEKNKQKFTDSERAFIEDELKK